jgi:hypothetical protein
MTLDEVKEMQNYGPHTSGCLARTVPALPSHSRQVLTYQNLKVVGNEKERGSRRWRMIGICLSHGDGGFFAL